VDGAFEARFVPLAHPARREVRRSRKQEPTPKSNLLADCFCLSRDSWSLKIKVFDHVAGLPQKMQRLLFS
jgi:hypothetical protein